MPKYLVCFTTQLTGTLQIEVEADSREEAEQAAREGGVEVYSETQIDYMDLDEIIDLEE